MTLAARMTADVEKETKRLIEAASRPTPAFFFERTAGVGSRSRKTNTYYNQELREERK